MRETLASQKQPQPSTRTFMVPRKIISGVGSLQHLGAEAPALGTHALLVTGRGALRAAGAEQKAIELLRAAGLEVTQYTGVTPDPTVGQADEARDMARSRGCDVVVGLGGGSALDVAKAAAGMMHHDASVTAVQRGEEEGRSGVPFVGVPTTAGTGSEITRNAVLTDPDRQVKASARSEHWIAAVAIVDPALLLTLPPNLTAASGMDAFVHATESFFSVGATPVTEALALRSVHLLGAALPVAHADGRDLGARSDCAIASLTAALAFANSGLGAVHGLAPAIGLLHNVSHGDACSIMLPHVLRFNRDAMRDKLDQFGAAIGVTARPAGDRVAAAVDSMSRGLAMPQRLRDVGVTEQGLERIADETVGSSSLKYNPRKASREDLLAMLREAF
ncbi:MAG: iron-containing alcohol dehydrogenase [Armatimonadota bacterium]